MDDGGLRNQSFLDISTTEINDYNETTEITEIGYSKTTLPPWTLLCYYILILVGLCMNLIVSLVLLRIKKNGILLFVLQLSIIDVFSTYLAGIEIWNVNNQMWTFRKEMCSVYLGSEVLFNTFVLYCLICINFHVISTYNLHLQEIKKNNKNPLTTECGQGDDFETEIPMVSSQSTTSNNRTMTIDYTKRKSTISIILPSTLIWFVCSSLSVPQFTLSTVVDDQHNSTLQCTIPNSDERRALQNLSLIFRTLIPLPLLIISFTCLTIKLFQSIYSRKILENLAVIRKVRSLKSYLFFAISTSILYFLVASHRHATAIYNVITQNFENSNPRQLPLLENQPFSSLAIIVSSMVYYGSGIFRAIMALTILPEINKHFALKKVNRCDKEESV